MKIERPDPEAGEEAFWQDAGDADDPTLRSWKWDGNVLKLMSDGRPVKSPDGQEYAIDYTALLERKDSRSECEICRGTRDRIRGYLTGSGHGRTKDPSTLAAEARVSKVLGGKADVIGEIRSTIAKAELLDHALLGGIELIHGKKPNRAKEPIEDRERCKAERGRVIDAFNNALFVECLLRLEHRLNSKDQAQKLTPWDMFVEDVGQASTHVTRLVVDEIVRIVNERCESKFQRALTSCLMAMIEDRGIDAATARFVQEWGDNAQRSAGKKDDERLQNLIFEICVAWSTGAPMKDAGDLLELKQMQQSVVRIIDVLSPDLMQGVKKSAELARLSDAFSRESPEETDDAYSTLITMALIKLAPFLPLHEQIDEIIERIRSPKSLTDTFVTKTFVDKLKMLNRNPVFQDRFMLICRNEVATRFLAEVDRMARTGDRTDLKMLERDRLGVIADEVTAQMLEVIMRSEGNLVTADEKKGGL